MDNSRKIEKYIFEFFSSRYDDLNSFYWSTYRDRVHGIYKLKNGNELMDFLNTVHSNIEERYYSERLIPHKFATPHALIESLDHLEHYLERNQKYLDDNWLGEYTSDIVSEIGTIKKDLLLMVDYAKKIYDYEDTVIPYQELRYNLITHNIPRFIAILKSILASVSYAIVKTQEGFFHSNVHLIIKLLGFEILSEELTNSGRIDSVIRFSDKIYIVEFKFSEADDLSHLALIQIKEKDYARKFIVERKEIYGIGVSFAKQNRNINGFTVERLD